MTTVHQNGLTVLNKILLSKTEASKVYYQDGNHTLWELHLPIFKGDMPGFVKARRVLDQVIVSLHYQQIKVLYPPVVASTSSLLPEYEVTGLVVAWHPPRSCQDIDAEDCQP